MVAVSIDFNRILESRVLPGQAQVSAASSGREAVTVPSVRPRRGRVMAYILVCLFMHLMGHKIVVCQV